MLSRQNNGGTGNYALALLAFLVCGLMACQPQIKSLAPEKPGVMSDVYQSGGLVEELDREKKSLKLNHEEIKGYMEPMSMKFVVRDATLLEGLSVGDYVRFTLEVKANVAVITQLQKAAPPTVRGEQR
jgi:Cu/Ag efflux protein CusF